MIPQDSREAQATACLKAADTHREQLLAVAVKLCGGDAGAGWDLFCDVLLNCHDAIQRRGFEGDRYEFYILSALRNQRKRDLRRARPTAPLTTDLAEAVSEETGFCPDDRLHLLGELALEIRQTLPPADRVLLRLHSDGHSYREIAALTGAGDYSWISRRMERLKAALRETFGGIWAGLGE